MVNILSPSQFWMKHMDCCLLTYMTHHPLHPHNRSLPLPVHPLPHSRPCHRPLLPVNRDAHLTQPRPHLALLIIITISFSTHPPMRPQGVLIHSPLFLIILAFLLTIKYTISPCLLSLNLPVIKKPASMIAGVRP